MQAFGFGGTRRESIGAVRWLLAAGPGVTRKSVGNYRGSYVSAAGAGNLYLTTPDQPTALPISAAFGMRYRGVPDAGGGRVRV